MTNLEEMNSNPNSTVLGYVGAALVGLFMQFIFQLNMAGELGLALLAIIAYTTTISAISYFGEKYDNKILLNLNEFWITIDLLVKNKMAEVAAMSRIPR